MENSIFLFDKKLLAKARKTNPKFYIGIDTYKGSPNCYCLTREIDGVVEILIAKQIWNDEIFNTEVNNLAKYFNATIIKEK